MGGCVYLDIRTAENTGAPRHFRSIEHRQVEVGIERAVEDDIPAVVALWLKGLKDGRDVQGLKKKIKKLGSERLSESKENSHNRKGARFQ